MRVTDEQLPSCNWWWLTSAVSQWIHLWRWKENHRQRVICALTLTNDFRFFSHHFTIDTLLPSPLSGTRNVSFIQVRHFLSTGDTMQKSPLPRTEDCCHCTSRDDKSLLSLPRSRVLNLAGVHFVSSLYACKVSTHTHTKVRWTESMTSQCRPVQINSSDCSRVIGIVHTVEGCPLVTSADDRPVIQITGKQWKWCWSGCFSYWWIAWENKQQDRKNTSTQQ